MDNKELRGKALGRIKERNFSFVSATAYFLAALTLLAGDITGIYALDIAITFVFGFVMAQFSAAGYVRVAMGMWRQGKGGFKALAAGFTSIRVFARTALPCAAYALLLTVFRHVVLGRAWYVSLIAGAAVFIGHIFVSYALYGCELKSDKPALSACTEGVKVAARGLGRILEMKLNNYWWIALIIAFTIYVSFVGGQQGFIVALITFLVGLVLRWMVGAYIALAEAGLARTLFKQE